MSILFVEKSNKIERVVSATDFILVKPVGVQTIRLLFSRAAFCIKSGNIKKGAGEKLNPSDGTLHTKRGNSCMGYSDFKHVSK